MVEFLVLLVVLIGMGLAGFTLLAMVVVTGLFVLFGIVGGMLALIVDLAPWILLVLLACWLLSWRRNRRPRYY
ncbi:envelope stress response protein PspG [Aeromonas diversa]|uniref:Phage shock protein G n=1 Tax=Aeromonas diversa CDC 2478-85 TaxID=1268237 RepID=N9VET6_9GAMM|nr:envelope stress response protein PspG [Aeromonas diversa]ENY73757.1 phage shock protein G [Aeromonas diversa CDC 2478-85]